jgi:hypothetical protein
MSSNAASMTRSTSDSAARSVLAVSFDARMSSRPSFDSLPRSTAPSRFCRDRRGASVQTVLIALGQGDGQAGKQGSRGDAGAHGAAADDADALNRARLGGRFGDLGHGTFGKESMDQPGALGAFHAFVVEPALLLHALRNRHRVRTHKIVRSGRSGKNCNQGVKAQETWRVFKLSQRRRQFFPERSAGRQAGVEKPRQSL